MKRSTTYALLCAAAACIMANPSGAQTPGGITGSTTILWLKADQTTPAVAGTINTWSDVSGTGNNMSQGTAASQPTRTNNAINFNPVVTFTSTKNMADANGVLTSSSNNLNVYVVNKVNSAVGANPLFTQTLSGANTPIFSFYSPNAGNSYEMHWGRTSGTSSQQDPFRIASGTVDWNAAAAPAGQITLSSLHVSTGTAVGVDNRVAYENGSQLLSDGSTVTATGSSTTAFTLGNVNGTDLAEMVIVSSSMTATQHQQVESYLAIKYGITLSGVNYLGGGGSPATLWNAATNTGYNNRITGIGNETSSGINQVQSKSINSGALLTLSNPSAFGTGDYLITGDNNGSINTALSGAGGPSGYPALLGRIWKAQVTNTPGTVTLSFDLSTLGLPAGVAVGNIRLVKNTSATFTAATPVAPASYTSGVVTFNTVNVASGDFFTLAFSSSDFGDAPDYYHTLLASNGPRHGSSTGLYLGTSVAYGQYDALSTDPSDNAFKANNYLPELYLGATAYSVTVPLVNSTGNDATLVGWIDFNHDSVFQASEAATANVLNGATTATLNWSTSSLNYVGMTWARFRISTDAGLTTATPGGAVTDGEVEDYYLWISDNKNCGSFNVTYITSSGTLGSSTVTESGSGGFTDFYTGGSGLNEFGSNNDNNLYYYASNNSFYWYDPITNTQGTLISDVQGLGTVPFTGTASGGPLSESAGYYFNGRLYFTLDNVDGSTTSSGTRCYYYTVDLAANGKSIVTGSLQKYGYIDAADHGDFVIIQESGAPVIYDISGPPSFRKISNLAALAGTTAAIPAGNITTYTLANGTGASGSLANAQMAYYNSTFYINQGIDMYKIVTTGPATATRSLVRTSAFSATPNDMGNNLCVADMGDLPGSFNNTLLANNGAEHGSFNTTVKLGTTITADEDGKPSTNADADGGDDGHPTFPTLVFTNYTVTIKMTKTTVSNAYLTAWLDFNNNGVFDANEQSATSTIVTTGTNISVTVTWPTVPVGATLLNRFARFRISTDNTSVQTATGYAPDGEVEDYKVTAIGVPLEVKLTSFSAQAQNHNSLLTWTTASEKNSAYFDVEYSTDGRVFTKIGDVKAQGNSDISHNYSYIHVTPVNGMNYYRLKMVDQDGSFKYSETRTVRFGDLSSGTITVAPNPTTGRTRIVLPAALSENGSVIVYNSMGMTIARIAAPGMQVVEFDLGSQPVGLYHLVVMDGDNAVYRDKVIKQ